MRRDDSVSYLFCKILTISWMSSARAVKPERKFSISGNTWYSSMHGRILEVMGKVVPVPLPNAGRLLSLRPFVFQTCWFIKLPVSVLFFCIPIIFCCNSGIAFARSAGSAQLCSHTFEPGLTRLTGGWIDKWVDVLPRLKVHVNFVSAVTHSAKQYRCVTRHSNDKNDIHNLGSQFFFWISFLAKANACDFINAIFSQFKGTWLPCPSGILSYNVKQPCGGKEYWFLNNSRSSP